MSKKNLHENVMSETVVELGEVCPKCGSGDTVAVGSHSMTGYDATERRTLAYRILDYKCRRCFNKFQVRENA
jgi:hypothetical protein